MVYICNRPKEFQADDSREVHVHMLMCVHVTPNFFVKMIHMHVIWLVN